MGARLGIAAAALVVAAICGVLAIGEPLNNYDTAHALLWGRDLAGGHSPDLERALAPTPHPLATLAGLVLALPGRGDLPYSDFPVWATMAGAYFSLALLAALVFALGRAWFGAAAGVVAAVIVLTREPVLSFGLRAYVDIPYLVLLLAALLVETRRARAGTPVLVLLAVAGLLRPEAWLFAGLYALWLWRGGALRPAHVALAATAPVVWALSDLALTGDALHSLTGTRENADALGRKTGLDDLPVTGPRRLGEVAREPVLAGAAAGIALTLWRARARALLPLVAGAAALVAFGALAAAGLPIITRYLLLPATLLAIFCAAALTGWARLDREDPARRPWLGLAVVVAILVAAFAPGQVDRIDRLDAALGRQAAILENLRGFFEPESSGDRALVDPRRCAPFTLPNRRAAPQLALWTGLDLDLIHSAIDEGVQGTYFFPTSPEVATDFVLDPRDRDRRLPQPGQPPGGVVSGRYWHAFENCG